MTTPATTRDDVRRDCGDVPQSTRDLKCGACGRDVSVLSRLLGAHARVIGMDMVHFGRFDGGPTPASVAAGACC